MKFDGRWRLKSAAVWYNLSRRNAMITKSELEQLLASTETYRVERTKSTTDKDKFGEAVCAFANDMPF